MIGVFPRRERGARDFSPPLFAKHRGKAMWGHNEKAAVYKPRREPSPETKLAHTLIMDF